MAPPPHAQHPSIFSVNSTSPSDDPTHSAGVTPSSEEDFPVTPETPSPKRSGFLRRNSKQVSGDTMVQSQAQALTIRGSNVDLPLSMQVIESPCESLHDTPRKIKEGSRFKTFSKRLSGAFSLKPPPTRTQLQISSQQSKQKTLELAGSTKSRPSLNYVRNSFHLEPKENKANTAPALRPIYNPPVVPNADQCEFPCLYDSKATAVGQTGTVTRKAMVELA